MMERGLTLIELLGVLALGAVLAGGALLGWRRVEAALRLDRALHQLAADLQTSRVLAIASATRVRLVFAIGTARYRRERLDDDGRYAVDLAIDLPPGITIADANSGGDLTFSARGDAENGTVTLVDRRGTERLVRLNQRGRITILASGA
jgi:prepilin-type N-terminal cleavage/methylation domain-containing protein